MSHRRSVALSSPPRGQESNLLFDADQQEAAVNEEVHDYLIQLDQLRNDCERRGDFLKAHECVNRMREVNLRYAKRVESKSHQSNVDAKVRLAEEHKAELLTFSRIWEDKLADYDAQAARVLDDLKAKHTEDYRSQEGILKVQLMNKRPRFSRKVMELRNLLERYIRQRNYLEAEEVKKQLVVLERYEVDSFDESLAATFDKRTGTLKNQYLNELNAVQQKIEMGREELLTQRKIEFEKLLRRHNNVFRELDQDTKLHVAKARHYIHRQVKALVNDPVKTGLELRGLSATVRDGQGGARRGGGGPNTSRRTAAGSAARARTPTAASGQRRSLFNATPMSSTTDDSRYGW